VYQWFWCLALSIPYSVGLLASRVTCNHRDNLPWILRNGVHCRSSAMQDPRYVNIGNPDLIEKRRTIEVPKYPGGTLSDYVPFYFTPFSPMAYNIKTGFNGIKQRPNEEIFILYSSLPKLIEDRTTFLFSDRHAALATARFSSTIDNLKWIPWGALQTRNFRRDNEHLDRFDSYQAEALVHRRLPLSFLIGVACYDDLTVEGMTKLADQVGVELDVQLKPEWYFR